MNWSQTHLLQPPVLFYRFSEWATIASVSPFLWNFPTSCCYGGLSLQNQALKKVCSILFVSVEEKKFLRNGNFVVRACAKDFCKNNFRCKRYSVQCFHFWKRKTNWFWRKYVKRKLFSGIILYGAPNKPEAYLEPSWTSAINLFLQK